MAGILKMMPVSGSIISGKEFVDFDGNDISIALEYKGSPINHNDIPKAIPLDFGRLPIAHLANFSVSSVKDLNIRGTLLGDSSFIDVNVVNEVKGGRDDGIECSDTLGFSEMSDVNGFVGGSDDGVECSGKLGFSDEIKGFEGNGVMKGFVGERDDGVECSGRLGFSDGLDYVNEMSEIKGFEGNGVMKGFLGKRDDGIESSGTLGFSDSQDHSHELSESSDMLDTPIDLPGIEWNSRDASSIPQAFSSEIWCEEEEASDGEALERRRRGKPDGGLCDPGDSEMEGGEESVDGERSGMCGRLVAEKPAKRGVCYHCHKGNRFTDKEACVVCDAKYCKRCILRVMGSMPEGRKCINCIGFAVDELKRNTLGKCSRVLKGLLLDSEVKQIMEAELSCAANQLPAENVILNGSPLSSEELMELRSCSNPPRNLKPGNYWYDKVSGFWGKEGNKPCQIITPQLNVGDPIKRDSSNGNTDILINGREITKAELLMLKSAGVQCAGSLCFWVDPDGTYQEEGMNFVKGNIWGRKRTKLLCSLLSLPTPESPNPGGQLNPAVDEGLPGYLNQRAICNALLVGNHHSGTSTVYKQARLLYGNAFSEEERENLKFMIQCNLYGYIGRLLEGREQFEEESLLKLRKTPDPDEPGPSATPNEIQVKSEYAIGQKLKGFSDWLINIMVSGNLDIIFPAATREYAPYVEELWKDAAFQATYSRRNELELPRVASYFLDKAVDIAKMDYEPSDDDILHAEGGTSFSGLASMEFSFPPASHDGYRDPAEQPDPITRYQLVRVQAKSLGGNCKWVEMFEDVKVVLFCVSLTEYDEYEVNSNGVLTNKMLESRRLFETLVTHPTFDETNFLLLLNKFDLLEEKIEHVPLKNCEWFQDFNPMTSSHSSKKSGNTLAQRAFHYIGVQFKRRFKELTGRKLYVSQVTSLKSDNVDVALRYAREIVRWEEEKWNYSFNDSSSDSNEMEQSSYTNKVS